MNTPLQSHHNRPAYAGPIKAGLFGAIIAVALVATGLAAFDSMQTHPAVAHRKDAHEAIAPAVKMGGSGTMLVFETLW
jgi:hypothetical protein